MFTQTDLLRFFRLCEHVEWKRAHGLIRRLVLLGVSLFHSRWRCCVDPQAETAGPQSVHYMWLKTFPPLVTRSCVQLCIALTAVTAERLMGAAVRSRRSAVRMDGWRRKQSVLRGRAGWQRRGGVELEEAQPEGLHSVYTATMISSFMILKNTTKWHRVEITALRVLREKGWCLKPNSWTLRWIRSHKT